MFYPTDSGRKSVGFDKFISHVTLTIFFIGRDNFLDIRKSTFLLCLQAGTFYVSSVWIRLEGYLLFHAGGIQFLDEQYVLYCWDLGPRILRMPVVICRYGYGLDDLIAVCCFGSQYFCACCWQSHRTSHPGKKKASKPLTNAGSGKTLRFASPTLAKEYVQFYVQRRRSSLAETWILSRCI